MISLPARRRFWAGLAANGLGRLLRIADQLLLVPLFLSAWGPQRYGEWVAVTSIATFVTIANFGICHAAFSDIVLRYSSGDKTAAARSFLTSLCLITIVVLVSYAILLAIVEFGDERIWASFQSVSPAEARSVLLILGLAALLTFYVEPTIGIVSAAWGIGLPNLIFAISKAIEVIGVAVVLVTVPKPVAVALAMLAATVFNLVANLVIAVRSTPWISFKLRDFDRSVLERTWKASLGFFCMFICINVIGVQVSRLIVFRYLGAEALTVFSVLVTYTRAARLLALMISQAAQVELGRAFAQRAFDDFKNLAEAVIGAAVSVAGIVLIFEVALAPYVIPVWTRGQVQVAWYLLGALAFVSLAGAYFDAVWNAVSATNHVTQAALGYALGLFLGLLLGLLLLPWLGLVAIGLFLLLPELGGAIGAVVTLGAVVPGVHIRRMPLGLWRSSLRIWSGEQT